MSELGKKLRAVREERGVSLQEIGLALKISPRIIASIETGEKSGQPAKTFLRGFVKSYAQYLKMDFVAVLEMFDSEYGMEPIGSKSLRIEPEDSTAASTKIASPKPAVGETPVRAAPFPSFPWGKALLAALLFVGIVILAKVVHKYQRERDLPTDAVVVGEPVPTVAAVTPSAESPLTPVLDPSSNEGSPAVAATPTPSPTPSPTPEATPTPTPSPTPTPTATPSPTPTPTPTPTPKPTPSPTPSPSATPSPSPSPKASESKMVAGTPFEVLVEAQKPVSVSFDYGNGKVSSIEMKRGDVQVIKSRTPFSLEAGDSSALTVFINGRAKVRTGSQPLKLRIPE